MALAVKATIRETAAKFDTVAQAAALSGNQFHFDAVFKELITAIEDRLDALEARLPAK